jgi:hypothetical protein
MRWFYRVATPRHQGGSSSHKPLPATWLPAALNPRVFPLDPKAFFRVFSLQNIWPMSCRGLGACLIPRSAVYGPGHRVIYRGSGVARPRLSQRVMLFILDCGPGDVMVRAYVSRQKVEGWPGQSLMRVATVSSRVPDRREPKCDTNPEALPRSR